MSVDDRYEPHFNGPDYAPKHDHARLMSQIERVKRAMSEGRWLTLGEIEALTGDPPASISAQLRHLRKKRFGGFTVEKRHRGERCAALWEYRVTDSHEGLVNGASYVSSPTPDNPDSDAAE